MDKKLKEKLSDAGLPQKMTKEILKLVEKLYLKDLQYAADILEIPINDEGNTTCTANEQAHFLVLMYGILNIQEHKLKNAKNSILTDIIKMNSKMAEELINLKSLLEE